MVNWFSDGLYVTPGDFNYDGAIETADFTVWRDSLGLAGLDQVAYGGGLVDQGDYDIWRANFGAMNAMNGNAALANDAHEPEPAGISLVVVLIGVFLGTLRFHFPAGD